MKSPLQWVRESLSPTIRKDTAEDVASARKEEAELGQSSVFDSLAPAAAEEGAAENVIAKPKTRHTEVRPLLAIHTYTQLTPFYSTNTPRRTSKSRIGS